MSLKPMLAALTVLGTPLAAQELVFAPDATLTCMGNNDGFEQVCIGLAAEQCMADTPGGDSTVGMGGCLGAEADWWDGRLNAAYQARLAEAQQADADAAEYGYTAPPQEETLRAMQRAWIAFRDAKCAWAGALWGGGTGQGPAMADCRMTTTAEQALYLERIAR
ncbi:lysozyme inhibitor LprI family protein [Pseudoponticoccus marisrubri]|uniref:Lysozyme inhibitor LprI-like N-terminal domain-containing protein n=1 Tax=Pseudoponticoccus marisrubri TaxID=1685382 RepID=A0A0W7WEP3_9RHOB|nr:lysozyme inhibitor LprI family protein [Pseudoponticoccus marisrubri]KUF09104.1 hypothetical protein AVJ23_19465 [Pseudoponticoccus marisrubri]